LYATKPMTQNAANAVSLFHIYRIITVLNGVNALTRRASLLWR